MTAILSPSDSLQHSRRISLDDNEIDYASSSTDWRAKYNEVVDMLAETRAELDDFHYASKELEAELEAELQRTEKAQQDLKVKVARAETERDEWKGKFMSLQTTHNTTTTSLQRELDKLRQEHQQIKVQLRELEMGNDDLERTERAVSSSLADMEAKYSKALEEKILLEHELIEKANLEEESQRLKDELRDANVEISILRDQLVAAASSAKSASHTPSTSIHKSPPSDDNLLDMKPPPDFQLSELGDSSEMPPPPIPSSATPRASSSSGQSALLQRAGFNKPNLINTSGIARSANLSSSYNSPTSSPRTPLPRANVSRNSSSISNSSVSSNATVKNKGVQMVSEMRARVRNLEQKIHTRVPRLRMGSITGRQTGVGPSSGNIFSGASSSSSSTSLASTAKTSLESFSNRRSHDSEQVGKKDKGDTSGWVLIMEDSPSPVKDKERERRDKRRLSSPTTAPTSFRSGRALSPTPSPSKSSYLNKSTMNTGIRRPQSRLSGGALSSATSSIPTPVSRPATPTFLPIPSVPNPSIGLKRSTGPGGPNPYSQSKRSSLGVTNAGKPVNSDMTELGHSTSRPGSNTPSSTSSSRYATDDYKHLPKLPALHSNVTVRPPAKPGSAASSALSKSRIGRPSGNVRRNSGDAISDMPKDIRVRSSNATAN
ncbi:hypothetical protein BDQ17DRAFT_1386057 [Cyathus striatus]|nr:hypothetical protein BDQ17DRAFT_1386057 [Cyathus striatus]